MRIRSCPPSYGASQGPAVPPGLGQAGQREELRAGPPVGAERAKHRGGHRGRSRRLHAAQRHAGVFRLDDHADARWLQLLGQPVGDLLGEALLHLGAAGSALTACLACCVPLVTKFPHLGFDYTNRSWTYFLIWSSPRPRTALVL